MGTKWKISKAEIKKMGLIHVHPETQDCHDRGCVVHHWSKHHMRHWPLVWRDDIGAFERTCPHGIGHPDPDGLNYAKSRMPWDHALGVHGCDGCCAEYELPEFDEQAREDLLDLLQQTNPAAPEPEISPEMQAYLEVADQVVVDLDTTVEDDGISDRAASRAGYPSLIRKKGRVYQRFPNGAYYCIDPATDMGSE